MADAECARRVVEGTAVPDMWTGDTEVGGMDEMVAKAICGSCPEQPVCYTYADKNLLISGVWGGVRWKRRERVEPLRQAAGR
jgi:hypothetical protein